MQFSDLLQKKKRKKKRRNIYSDVSRREGNVFFNDAVNTFYLRLYDVGHMVKDHSDMERGNPMSPHGNSFRLAARVLLYASSHSQDNRYHGVCYTSRGALAETRNISMDTHTHTHTHTHTPMKDRSDDLSRTLLPRSYISLRSRLSAYVYITVSHLSINCSTPVTMTCGVY